MSRADRLYQLFGRDYQTDPHNTLKIRQQTTREATVSECPSLKKTQAIALVLLLSLGLWAMIWGLLLAIPVSAGTDL